MTKIKRKLYLIGVLLVAIFIIFYSFTLARYVSNSAWDYYLNSKGFYFSSDYLAATKVNNVDSLWDGNSVHFNIKNTLNEAVITAYDIDYQVSCTLDAAAAVYSECRLNGSVNSSENKTVVADYACVNNTGDSVDVTAYDETNCDSGGYDWTVQAVEDDLYFDIVLTNSNYSIKDVTATIEVTTTSPYAKEITGEFKLKKIEAIEGEVSLSYENYSIYDRLIVSNPNLSIKCVKVTWDSDDLLIDKENSSFSSYSTDASGYINEIIFNISAKKDINYMFYPRDSGTYDVNDFTIANDSGC